MRLIASILMILVLFLAGQPLCSAAFSEQRSEHCCQSENGPCENDRSDDDHEDACSGCNPFQTCSCCVMGIVAPVAVAMKFDDRAEAIRRTENASVSYALSSSFLAGVWQPPRQN